MVFFEVIITISGYIHADQDGILGQFGKYMI
jgi:hypothetical protein